LFIQLSTKVLIWFKKTVPKALKTMLQHFVFR